MAKFPFLAKDDYVDAIQCMTLAMDQLIPDGRNCNICGDTDHQAFECDHNPLRLAKKWKNAVSVWKCWHCGFIATSDVQAVNHFGKTDSETARCLNDSTELLTAARLALPLMESFFRANEGKGTIKRLKQAINNLEEKT